MTSPDGSASCHGRSTISAAGSISSVEAVNWPVAVVVAGRPAKRLPNVAAKA